MHLNTSKRFCTSKFDTNKLTWFYVWKALWLFRKISKKAMIIRHLLILGAIGMNIFHYLSASTTFDFFSWHENQQDSNVLQFNQ